MCPARKKLRPAHPWLIRRRKSAYYCPTFYTAFPPLCKYRNKEQHGEDDDGDGDIGDYYAYAVDAVDDDESRNNEGGLGSGDQASDCHNWDAGMKKIIHS